MPEDSRLKTEYFNKYRDWKQKPYHVNKKDFYIPPKALFKTDSEYEKNYKVINVIRPKLLALRYFVNFLTA